MRGKIWHRSFVFDTTKQFINSGVKAFLQSFKPNAEIAPHLSDTTKGLVSDLARATDEALNKVGISSEKLGLHGHAKRHPLAEEYYSQIPFRHGAYVAKPGVIPVTPGLKDMEE